MEGFRCFCRLCAVFTGLGVLYGIVYPLLALMAIALVAGALWVIVHFSIIGYIFGLGAARLAGLAALLLIVCILIGWGGHHA